VIPENCNNIIAVEAGVGVCWDKLIGKKGKKITMDSFGVSAPGDQALQHFGFTISNVIKQTKKLIKKNG
jgi:transketolase